MQKLLAILEVFVTDQPTQQSAESRVRDKRVRTRTDKIL